MQKGGAEVHLQWQKRSDLGSTPSAANPDAPRIPTVTLINHRRILDRRSAHRGLSSSSPCSFRATRADPGELGWDGELITRHLHEGPCKRGFGGSRGPAR
ncbi:hypothetical protein SKAU_G00345680 [Synaphobranchus kaupii]|uniref:Uncharacterized protein n=1 Tax=Synaphobranchus kaupii TaxID=118154 RepID=A0A9Q1EJI3_SYNKA|nr:hypothetical protein SKAU_G00345680 [Synaphobranchus kaupii]